MRKAYKNLAAVFAVLLLSVSGAHAVQFGMPFGFGNNTTFGSHGGGAWGSDIGLRIHLTEMVAIQPSLSVGMMDDVTNLGVNFDVLFYLWEGNTVKQYLGGAIGFNVTEGDNSDMRLGGIFGLQHEVTNAIDIFAQTGFSVRFDPGRFYTVNTQLGVIFYLSK